MTQQTAIRHRVFSAPSIKKIQRLQTVYINQLVIPKWSIRPAIRRYKKINKAYRRLNGYLARLERVYTGSDGYIQEVIKTYRQDLTGIHDQHMRWYFQVLDILLNTPVGEDYCRQWRYRHIVNAIRRGANEARERIQTPILKHQLRTRLRDAYARARYELRYKFETVLLAESAVVMSQKESDTRVPQDPRWYERLREFIRDHIYGYNQPDRQFYPVTQMALDRGLEPEIRRFEKARRQRFRMTGLALVCSGVILTIVLNLTGWDRIVARNAWMLWRDIKSVMTIFPAPGEKNSYFEQELLDLNVDVSRETLRANLTAFIDQKYYERDNRYLIFGEMLLRDYMILLARDELDAEFKRDMYRAGFLLDADLVDMLDRLTVQYDRPVIRESELRDVIFDMRRLFVRNDVYPFMFLVLHEQTPYVFVYTERITGSMPLRREDVASLGIDPFWFDEVQGNRLKAHMMTGENYPFHGKAGFFEGEFAVVFTSLSTRPEWTGWHELAHVVDYMEFTYANIIPLDNVEVTAVLFPMIFADDPADYMAVHVFPKIRSRDRKDYYVQAAKGILNGAIIYFNATYNENRPLITNRFEEERIAWIEQRLALLSDSQLSALGRIMYQDPYTFLATAEKARYRSVETNAEEIIYGTHGSPQKEVIELASLGSIFGSNQGPRFVRDGQDGGDDSDAIKRAALIRAILVFVLFELLAVATHLLATPIRRRKMQGILPGRIVDRMFASDWAKSHHKADHSASAIQMLKSLFDSSSNKGETFRRKIDMFRLNANHKERLLFHAGLSLAPTIPQSAVIKNEFQLLLFYLPFIGPYLARQRWIFPRQRAFYLREKFNARIRRLIMRSPADIPTSQLITELNAIMEEFEQTDEQAVHTAARHAVDFRAIEQWVLAYLERVFGHVKLNYDGRWMDLSSLSKAMDRGSEFDRLDKYEPGDDIRMIDWNVTARSTTQTAMVRKRIMDSDVQVAFLFDLTTLNTTINQKKWAADLAKSIRAVGHNNHLKSVIYLYPDGTSVVKPVKIHSKVHYKQLAIKMVHMVEQQWLRSSEHLQTHRFRGLKFYSLEENQRYRQQLNWLSFDETDQHPVLKHLKIQNHTIFMIGTKPQKKRQISRMLSARNKAIFW